MHQPGCAMLLRVLLERYLMCSIDAHVNCSAYCYVIDVTYLASDYMLSQLHLALIDVTGAGQIWPSNDPHWRQVTIHPV